MSPKRAVFSIAGSAALILIGYEILRSVASSRFIADYGSGHLPWLMALSPLAIVLMTAGYGIILRRLRPRRTFFLTLAISALAMAGFWAALQAGVRFASPALYLFAQGYIVILIEECWSFVNSTLTADQAKRLNGPMIGISSLGSIAGGLLTGVLAVRVGSENVLLLAAAVTAAAIVAGTYAFSWGGEPEPPTELTQKDGTLSLGIFRTERRVRDLAWLIVCTQSVATLTEVMFYRALEAKYPALDARTSFQGYFWGALNGGAVLLQFLVIPILLRRFSLRSIHTALPLLEIGVLLSAVVAPALATAAAALYAFKALDYSIFRAGKEMFYIPLSFEARYRAKIVIDAFIYRTSKGMMSGLVSLGELALGAIGLRSMAVAAIGFEAAWLYVVRGLARRHEEATAPSLAKSTNAS